MISGGSKFRQLLPLPSQNNVFDVILHSDMAVAPMPVVVDPAGHIAQFTGMVAVGVS